MRYCVAPLEGLTGVIFRRIHHRFFPGADKYYTPFLSPSRDHVFTRREKREILPEYNEGLPVVPQLLTRRAEDFLWAANRLFEMGYPEVNLNLGCPSGTVTAKGKGSGFLAFPEELDAFLAEIFAGAPGPVSIKTRLGIRDPEEFWPILECYNRYPVYELTVHLRVQKDMYRHPVRGEYLAPILAQSRNPVCYNGDLIRPGDLSALTNSFPGLEAVMIGRGLMADPALISVLQGGKPLERATLRAFHDALYEAYAQAFDSRRNAMLRMKELWFYLIHRFEGAERYGKQLRKASDPRDFEAAVERIFTELPLRPETVPGW